MKQKSLPTIRIDDKTGSNMQMALKKLNEKSLIEITFQQFRRICYEFCSQEILNGKDIKLSQSR